MKVRCPRCQREVDVTKHGKYAPHNTDEVHAVRCSMSSRRYVQPTEKNKK